MPYIPTTITHKSSGAIWAYANTVSGGSATPEGVKSITAGYGIGGGGSSGAVALSNAGIVTITGSAGVTVSTVGDTTTLTSTAGGATSGTLVSYQTLLDDPFLFTSGDATILCTLETPTTNNYCEVNVGFLAANPSPYVAPVLQSAFGAIQLGLYLSPSSTLSPSIISNSYGSMIAETSAISNIPFTLPDPSAQSTYPTNSLFMSSVSPTPVTTWYIIGSNYNPSADCFISAATCSEIRTSLYANNIVTS
jgi:hypothetical protein